MGGARAFSWAARLRSFAYAARGLGMLLGSQHNAWIHLVATLLVVGAGLVLGVARGEWLAPPVIVGTFLVNLGNMMKRWSNDRFLSTPHGVLNDSGKDRYSIAFFYSPNVDATIACLPSCVSAETPARYEPAVYRDLVLAFYNANYFHRPGHAPAAAASR